MESVQLNPLSEATVVGIGWFTLVVISRAHDRLRRLRRLTAPWLAKIPEPPTPSTAIPFR